MASLNHTELLALSKFDVSKKVREHVAPGEYEVDEVVRISGTIKVGVDHAANIAARVPWQKLVAVLLDKVNGATIESVVAEALAADLDGEEIAERAANAMATLVESTRSTRKGAVKVSLHVESVTK